MTHLSQQLGQQLSQSWLGMSSVCSERGYSHDSRFEPKSVLRIKETM